MAGASILVGTVIIVLLGIEMEMNENEPKASCWQFLGCVNSMFKLFISLCHLRGRKQWTAMRATQTCGEVRVDAPPR